MADVKIMARPQRWDSPFGPEMGDEDVRTLLKRPEIAAIQADKFPATVSLAGVLKNDTRIVRFQPGDIIVREGDYGNSAFLILEGKVRVVISPGLPDEVLGRQITQKKSFLQALSQIWTNRWIPEVRDTRHDGQKSLRKEGSDAQSTRVFLQDIPGVLDAQKTAQLTEGAIFGELAALGRVPRTATIFAESDAALLEIRWQGLRELRKYDEGWRRVLDQRYRENALKVHLGETPLFSGLNEQELQDVADHTLFETYGTFDWNVSYQALRSQNKADIANEPMIAREGGYPDGLLMIRAGFARVSIQFGTSERTLTYLGKGDYFGLDELYGAWRDKKDTPLESSLTAISYLDVLRVPTQILERYVFPKMTPPKSPMKDLKERPIADDALLAWSVGERFVYATQAMLIDLDKCTRCDDCVRACASTHGGNPRFIRHGKTFDHWMVANACMHCADPVCMIGCPTGAIHRDIAGGMIVINDNTCIGCGTCANSCPYDNIRMVPISDLEGNPVLDPDLQKPIMKATKCDLCASQLGGPACVRACPHDALERTDFQAVIPIRKHKS